MVVKVQARTRSGRPSRAQEEPGREHAPAEIRRLRDAAMRGLRDPEWGTELGVLYLERKITAAMYGVGKWWREMAEQYLSAIDAPWPTARTTPMERQSNSSDTDPDTEEGRKRAVRERNAVEQFREAHAVLISAGLLAETYVRELCEGDKRPLGTTAVKAVSEGLERLVQWKELTNRAKSG